MNFNDLMNDESDDRQDRLVVDRSRSESMLRRKSGSQRRLAIVAMSLSQSNISAASLGIGPNELSSDEEDEKEEAKMKIGEKSACDEDYPPSCRRASAESSSENNNDDDDTEDDKNTAAPVDWMEKDQSVQSRRAMIDAILDHSRSEHVEDDLSDHHSPPPPPLQSVARRPLQQVVSAPSQLYASARSAPTSLQEQEAGLKSPPAWATQSAPVLGHHNSNPRDCDSLQPGAVCVRGISAEPSSTLSNTPSEIRMRYGSQVFQIEANIVDDDDELQRMQEELRHQIMQEAVPADVIDVMVPRPRRAVKKDAMIQWGFGLVVLLAVVLGLGLGFGLTRNKNDDGDDNISQQADWDNRPTLDIVRERGYVLCGTNDFYFGSYYDQAGNLVGIFAEYCKAVALLALGDVNKVEYVHVLWTNRFAYLANRTVDLLSEATTHTMGRDIQEPTTQTGYSFSTPYFHSGLAFAGISTFVDCADNLDFFYGECRALKVCVAAASTHMDVLKAVKLAALHPVSSTEEMAAALKAGDCNVIAGEPPQLATLKGHELVSDWKISTTTLSKEPLALVTRDGDPEWTGLVNLVVAGLIWAEGNNITKNNADEIKGMFSATKADGDDNELPTLLTKLVTEFGNHGDLYREFVEDLIPRSILNKVQDGTQPTGLMYATPFGNLLEDGPGPMLGSHIHVVLNRGYLVCGVPTWRGAGFAAFRNQANSTDENSINSMDWSGIDVEFCRGLAAAIFAGEVEERVVLNGLGAPLDSYTALSDGTVDVVAGARVSLQVQYLEPSTEFKFRFSEPYFYNATGKGGAYALMTRAEDVEWSDLVNWLVIATIFADEEGITRHSSAEMPVVSLFGVELLQMFRDSTNVVGSIQELWNNTLGDDIPREAANLLNRNPRGPQLYAGPAV